MRKILEYSMLVIPLLVFVGVAYAGYLMANEIRTKKGVLAPILDLHRYSALAGMALMAGILIFTHQSSYSYIAGGIILATVLGGFSLFRIIFSGKQKPIIVVYAHASLGCMGILALIVAILSPSPL